MNQIKFSIRLADFVLYLLIALFLDFELRFGIAGKVWGFINVVPVFNLSLLFQSLIYFVLLLIIIRNIHPSSELIRFVVNILCGLYFMPSLVLYYNGYSNSIIINSFLFFILLITIFSYCKLKLSIPVSITSNKLLIIFALTILFLIPFFIFYGFSLDYNLLLLKDVYTVRFATKGLGNLFTDYLFSFLSLFLIPISLIYSIEKKRYLYSAVFGIFIIYLYLIMGHKTVFFGLFIVLLFYFLRNFKNVAVPFFLVSIVLGILSHILSTFTGNRELEAAIVMRIYFLPSLISSYYFEYFSNINVIWSHSFLSHFVNYPFDLEPQYIIGKNFFGSAKVSANTGFISDGYMNFGYFGIFINTLIVSLIFWIFDNLNVQKGYFGFLLVLCFLILNIPTLTCILTSGVFLLIIFSLFFFKDINSSSCE